MRLRRPSLPLILSLTCCLSLFPATTFAQAAAPAAAQTAASDAAPAIPDTPAGKLLGQWLESINSGDREKILSFQSHLANAPNPERRLNSALGLRQRTGGFELRKIESSTANRITGVVKEKNSENLARFELTVLETDPNKIDVFGVELISAPPPNPADVAPVSRMPVKQLTEEVDGKLAKLTAEDKFSGTVLIAKDGKALWQKAYGLADREAKTPNNLETRFRLGSMNKMFTSVAIAQLVQQGKLKFTDTLAQVLPDYPNQEVAKKITIDNLLTHTSGLGDYFNAEFDEKRESLHDLKDYLPLFSAKSLQFEPGKGWAYSNAGFLVLGLVIEKLSGQSYYDYVKQHIYDVAGMKNSGSFPITQKVPNLAVGYTHGDNEGGPLAPNTGTLPWRGSSAGGGDSTVGDLLKFDQALRGNKLLNAELTRTVITGKVAPPRFPPGVKYGYGFGDKNPDGDRIVGHNGGAPGMNAQLDIHWNTGYTVVVLANLDPPAAGVWAKYISDRLPLEKRP